MGTHPDGPSRVRRSNMKLSDYIYQIESSVYETRENKEKHLPFIMKLMSIAKTLSIQAHPTKEQAARLNDRDPIHYPDRNHKPELAYALTRFELLCGFRPAKEISQNFKAFPELRELMGLETSNAFSILVDAGIQEECATLKAALAVCFKNMLHTQRDNPVRVTELLTKLLQHLCDGVRGCLSESTVEVVRKMALDFPGDVGCFSPLFLNHLILEPGECCYYAAEELHNYLSGECIECVGCSNNTVRAACTPKFIDIDAICEVLNYRMTEASFYLVPPTTLKDYPAVNEYAPDCKDFTLHQIKVSAVDFKSAVPIPPLACGSIMVIINGSGAIENYSDRKSKTLCVSRGDVIYIASNAQICFVGCSEDIQAYRTFSFEEGPDHSLRNTTVTTETASKVTVKRKGKQRYLIVEDNAEGAELFELETEMDGVC
ncbi:hypothetical protein AB6A40_008175 [Gnathostoma spinigerum]|uniref:mannose-6-phosphate isomerase n=1 Tax=Gnathostoma spinigerum TaxID=75299 RepID=A0ABD6EQ98_9BILA